MVKAEVPPFAYALQMQHRLVVTLLHLVGDILNGLGLGRAGHEVENPQFDFIGHVFRTHEPNDYPGNATCQPPK
jgi:hypothetical protein